MTSQLGSNKSMKRWFLNIFNNADNNFLIALFIMATILFVPFIFLERESGKLTEHLGRHLRAH